VTFSASGSESNTRILIPQGADVGFATVNLLGTRTDFGVKTVMENGLDQLADMDSGDIDNDGDIDFVLADYNDHDIFWYNNTNGDGTSWTRYTIDDNYYRPRDLRLVDLNGDGTLDLTAGSSDGNSLVWYNNTDGKGRAWSTRIIIDSAATRNSDIEVADLDNDGDMDLATTSRHDSNGGVRWYNNTDSNGTAFVKHIIAPLNWAEDVLIVDLDKDGDNDTVATNSYYDDVVWYENRENGTNWSAQKIISNNGLVDGASLAAADINEDNRTDIIGLGQWLRWFEAPANLANAWTPHSIANPGISFYHGEVVVADMGYYGNEPDGHLDLAMVTTQSNSVRWYENNPANPGSTWTSHIVNPNHNDARCIRAIDIGGKPYPDLIVAAYTGTNDDLVWYEVNMSYPKNVRLDVGGDGDIEYSAGAGYLQTSKSTGDLSDELDSLLASGNPSTDAYGNKLITVPLKLMTDMPGRITVSGIDIIYDYTATAEITPVGTLADELQQHIGPAGSGTGKTNVPLKFSMDSAGKLRIDDLYIVFNDYPELLYEIPSTGSIPEDTRQTQVLDLSPYFKDDFLDSTDLTYEVLSYSNDTIVDVFITDSYYLAVDAETGDTNDNWVGSTDVVVRAFDDDGLTVDSNEFRIDITPVNDEPVRGSDPLPTIIMKEGLESNPLFLIGSKYYFEDVENDQLYFTAEIDPEDVFDGEHLLLDIDPSSWALTLTAQGDWYGDNIPLRVYCDDDPDVDKIVFRDTVINVQNVEDDAPVWSPMSALKVHEGAMINELNNLIQLTEFITDIDDDIYSIKFSVVSFTNDSALNVLVDTQAYIDMSLDDKDFNGMTRVILRAEDPAGNYADTVLDIIVLPVNDPPAITLKTPVQDATILTDSTRLNWQGHDVDNDDSELTYSVYFDDAGGSNLLAANIKGTSIWVDGLENGYTYFWRVTSSDGMAEGESELFSFFVIYGEVPTTTLVRPWDDAVINKNSVILQWSYSYLGTESFVPTYDLYFSSSNDSSTGDFSLAEPFMSDLVETEANLTGLEDGMRYYWTVVPKFGDGTIGKCSSGVFDFKVDLSAVSYRFKMELVEETEVVKRGEILTTQIQLENLGSNRDMIEFQAESDVSAIKIAILELGDDWIYTIEPGQSVSLTLTIDATTAPVSTPGITITATSGGDGTKQTDTLALTVEKPDEDTDGTEVGLFGNTTMLLIIVIVITAILLIITFILMLRKKKEDEDLDIEDVLPEEAEYGQPQMIDAELVSGPMSIGEIGRPGGPGTGRPGLSTKTTISGGPRTRRLPPPKIGTVVKKKKRIRPRPFPGEDYMPPGPAGSERDGAVLSVKLPDLGEPQVEPARDRVAASPDDDLSFKRPDEAVEKPEEVIEDKPKKRGPKVRLPGE
jgi:hypothetical protein